MGPYIPIPRQWFTPGGLPEWHKKRHYSEFEAYLDLYQKAAWKDQEAYIGGKVMTIGRGQILSSNHELARAWRWDRRKVTQVLRDWAQRGLVTVLKVGSGTDPRGSLYTVEHYDSYAKTAPVAPPADPPVDPPANPPVGPPVDPPANPPANPPVGPPVGPPAPSNKELRKKEEKKEKKKESEPPYPPTGRAASTSRYRAYRETYEGHFSLWLETLPAHQRSRKPGGPASCNWKAWNGAMLATGDDPDLVRDAMLGSQWDSWEDRVNHNSLAKILRRENLERFAEWHRAPESRPNPQGYTASRHGRAAAGGAGGWLADNASEDLANRTAGEGR